MFISPILFNKKAVPKINSCSPVSKLLYIFRGYFFNTRQTVGQYITIERNLVTTKQRG